MESRRARAPIERTLPAWLPARFVDEAEAWPLRRGLLALGDEPAFPSVERWSPLLAAAGLPDPGVRFERQAPRPRRRGRGLGASGSALPGYDASIVERGVVPSREGSWHDLLNCLVWHAFPRSKAVLHRRQLAAQRAEAAAGDGVAVNGERASGRPGQPPGVARGDAAVGRPRGAHARSPHRDALALLDEGGVLLGRLGASAPTGTAVVDDTERFALFGHALHEQRQRGAAVVTALLLELELAGPPPGSDADWLTALDAALEAALTDASVLAHPAASPRVAVHLGHGRIERLALPARSRPVPAPLRA